VPAAGMLEIDQWILMRTEKLVRDCRAWYDELAFHRVYQALYNFAITDLSAIYFDILKDRLYTRAPDSLARRSAQTALWRITYALARLMAPLLVYTTEEVWSHLARPAGAPESVHMAEFPAPEELTAGLGAGERERFPDWEQLMEIRDLVLKSLEVARQEKFIGAPLEARVHLAAGSETYSLLDRFEQELPSLFIVSQVALEERPGVRLSVHIERAEGEKCERCWKYTSDVGSHPQLPTICASCAEVVSEVARS